MKNFTHQKFNIYQFEELESTNSKAKELANLGNLFEREIIMADSQKSGRGRLDRKWESPPGNLYFSLVLQPKIELNKIAEISFVAATALRLTLESLLENSVDICNKWPNDLLISQQKIAGILLESEIQNNEARFVILGIGVNLTNSPDGENSSIMFPATNLKKLGVEISSTDFLKIFLNEFDALYQNWLDFGFAGIRKLWLQKAFRLGEKITVKFDDEVLVGVFEDVDLAGNLNLKIDGKIRKISTADVS